MSKYELVSPIQYMATFIGYYYFINFYATLYDSSCALTTVITLAACSKWDKRERPLLSGHR